MIVETNEDYVVFRSDIKHHNHFMMLAVPTEDYSIHVASSKLSAIFLKDVETDKTYIFPFDHPDSMKHISFDMLKIDLDTQNWIWTFDKKSAEQLIGHGHLLDIDLFTHLNENYIIDKSDCETFAHKLIRRNNQNERNLNKIIPLFKHKEMFEKMCDQVTISLKEPGNGYRSENGIVLQTLAKLEQTGIHVNPICFKHHFPDALIHEGDLVYSQYNLYTSTGRPSNRFDNVNYAALNKNDGTRKCFTSRFGDEGKMVLIDYSAFHPRIISYLIKFPIPIDTDIYAYLGELYFNRKVTEYDMDEIKSITMRQFYGGIEEKYQHIKYLAHANEFKEKYWNSFKEKGFIETPLFERVITNKHLIEANPNKLFNYILQATETEIAISVLKEVIKYLSSYKTKAVLYTYDSILFDFYKPEGNELLQQIVKIMKMGNRFPIKVYEGVSYDDVVQISV